MSMRTIKHALKRLSAEEKVIGIGGLLVIFGTFMPWYSVVLYEEGSIESGFSGDLGVIGFIVFLITVLAILHLLAENIHIRLPSFGYKKEQILLFLMGEAAFLVLLSIAIYTKRSLEFTNAELRFGIYLALIGAVLGTFAAFATIQKTRKKEVEAFFDHSEEEEMAEMEEEKETPKPKKAEKKEKEPEPLIEDEMVEEVGMETEEAEEMTDAKQGDYLIREAQMYQEPMEESATEEEPEKKKGEAAPGMSFYEDQ